MDIDLEEAAIFAYQQVNKITCAMIANNVKEDSISKVAENLPHQLFAFLIKDQTPSSYIMRRAAINSECNLIAARIERLWLKVSETTDAPARQKLVNEYFQRLQFEEIKKRVVAHEQKMTNSIAEMSKEMSTSYKRSSSM